MCYTHILYTYTHTVDYAVASESVAIDALDPLFTLERDVKPGEVGGL